jgi:hypothetical protein
MHKTTIRKILQQIKIHYFESPTGSTMAAFPQIKTHSTRRVNTNCTFCDEVFDGKTLRMKKHGLNCKKIKMDVKAQIVLRINVDNDATLSLG